MAEAACRYYARWGRGATAYRLAKDVGMSPSSHVTDILEELHLDGTLNILKWIKPNGTCAWEVLPTDELYAEFGQGRLL